MADIETIRSLVQDMAMTTLFVAAMVFLIIMLIVWAVAFIREFLSKEE